MDTAKIFEVFGEKDVDPVEFQHLDPVKFQAAEDKEMESLQKFEAYSVACKEWETGKD